MGTSGYGLTSLSGKVVGAHRAAYTLLREPIPPGKHLDHLCRVRACVNPWHLDVVTCTENIRRGTSPSAANCRKTQCPKGHPYDAENTIYTRSKTGNRKRHCRECQRIWHRAYEKRLTVRKRLGLPVPKHRASKAG
jgi:hypothetical protein